LKFQTLSIIHDEQAQKLKDVSMCAKMLIVRIGLRISCSVKFQKSMVHFMRT